VQTEMIDQSSRPEFRFYYFTPRYDETVRFYRDSLGFSVFRQWDRPDGDRGTIFHSPNGGGLIEVEAGETAPSILGGLYIEVSDIDLRYRRLRLSGVEIKKELGHTSYGHRNFKIVDPNGIEIAFFQYVSP